MKEGEGPIRPHISVVIPTCNRADDLRRCLHSLERVVYPSWDALVVDQSDDARSETVVTEYTRALPQLRYRRLSAKGTSRARNMGIARTSGDVIAFLDDDCTVPPHWLSRAAEVFAHHPKAAHAFGALRPGNGVAEWSAAGWTPARHIAEENEATIWGGLRGLSNRLRLPQLTASGACMFVRREVLAATGDFDVHLGPGTHFPSSEDGDLTYRALMAGYSVVCSPAIEVEHHGLRDYASGAAAGHLRAYSYGTGAWHMKQLRLGDPFAVVWIARELRRTLAYVRPIGLLGRGPTGLGPLVALIRGLAGSYRLAVDRQRGIYKARAARC